MVRLVASFLLLSLLVVSAASFSAYALAARALEAEVLTRLKAIADIREESLERWVEDQKDFIVTQSGLTDIREAATLLSKRSENAVDYQLKSTISYQKLHQYFDTLLENQRNVEEIFLMSGVGGQIAISTDSAQEGEYRSTDIYFVEGKEGLFVQGVYPSPIKQRPMITISMPVLNLDDELAAVLAIHLNSNRLDEILQPSDENNSSGQESYVVDQFNVFVSAKGFGRSGFPRGVHTEGIDAAVRGESGTGLYNNYKNIPVIGVYQWLEDYNLALLVEVPQSEALKPARILLRNILVIGVVSAVLLSLGIYFLARQISQPILAISRTARRIASGDLNASVSVATQDEVGVLAKSFNQMTYQLRRSQQQLADYSHSVEQKADELEATLANLTHAQRRLVQAEKMSSLGQLVAGVAHEINNPVTFIYGNISFAKSYVDELLSLVSLARRGASTREIESSAEKLDVDFLVEDFKKLISSIQTGAERIREIVESLQNYSRLDEAEQKQVQIHDGIESTLTILASRLKANGHFSGIHVQKKYDVLPAVICYPGPLNQVLMNLLSNAIDALQEREEILPPEVLDECPNQITITTYQSCGWVKIAISDNGVGMPPEVQTKVFDYLFTTKPSGRGTGMGLSISRDIIEVKHGGRLEFKSQLGKGTTFQIVIPVYGQAG
ncbi:ATP-binding protein [Oscillatoria sp. CS-180]|uniref:ATP-binding protein n=1 Tax=Oscillatoria sp. CS-180 TaxID=3021720 RepID=UPI00232C53A1|nr:ATP-binding protein [Oscillatoria sp. CS-180]MDB9526679.1 ATP-binding protein [Oscillatoria sp. CS-180]